MATSIPPTVLQEPISSPALTPLQNGDHLTREEFEQRYEATPSVEAELIEGVVYMASPVNHQRHGKPHGKLMVWLGVYAAGTQGVEFADNSSLKLDARNEPQPDALLYILPSFGGQARIDPDGSFVGAPEWAGEVAASSASYNLHVKLDVYRRLGVKEYVVWRVLDRAIDWFMLQGDKYEPLPLSEDGYYRSTVFPGHWLDAQALVTGDLSTALRIVQQGLASP